MQDYMDESTHRLKFKQIATMLPTKRSELIHALGLIPHSEGGYFLETHRSGCTPMAPQGITDRTVGERDLVQTATGEARNALTSIYYVPTIQSPKLLGIYKSDHVHYYHGGQPFEYILYDPITEKLEKVVLGPDICYGEKLQVPVRGGLWKCGHVMTETSGESHEFSMIGEAVGPGFDTDDFTWITIDMLERHCPLHIQKVLKEYVKDHQRELISSMRRPNRSLGEPYIEEEKKDPLSPCQFRRLFQLNYEPI